MFSNFSIAVSPNTSEEAATTQKMTLPKGIIKRVEVVFPDGCAGLVAVQIFRGRSQVWPYNPGEAFRANNDVIGFDEYILLTDKPFTFTAKVWNEDQYYSHTPVIRFLVEEERYGEMPTPEKQFGLVEGGAVG